MDTDNTPTGAAVEAAAADAPAGAEEAATWPGAECFAAVQDVLERNAVLITQINANQAARTTEALQRNYPLVKELSANLWRVVDSYGGLAETLLQHAGGVDGGGGGEEEDGDEGRQQKGGGDGGGGAAADVQQQQQAQQQQEAPDKMDTGA